MGDEKPNIGASGDWEIPTRVSAITDTCCLVNVLTQTDLLRTFIQNRICILL